MSARTGLSNVCKTAAFKNLLQLSNSSKNLQCLEGLVACRWDE